MHHSLFLNKKSRSLRGGSFYIQSPEGVTGCCNGDFTYTDFDIQTFQSPEGITGCCNTYEALQAHVTQRFQSSEGVTGCCNFERGMAGVQPAQVSIPRRGWVVLQPADQQPQSDGIDVSIPRRGWVVLQLNHCFRRNNVNSSFNPPKGLGSAATVRLVFTRETTVKFQSPEGVG